MAHILKAEGMSFHHRDCNNKKRQGADVISNKI